MSHLAKVDHDFIRYANVWEDAAVLRAGLNIEPGEKVLSIASAGDNCFALLLDDPSLIVTCDINQVQLHLLQLKMAAIRQLDYDKLKFFLGFTGKGDHVARLEIFRQLKNAMEPELSLIHI